MADGVLDEILRTKRGELAALAKRELPEAPARRAVELRRKVNGKLSLITEIKRRSPSAGKLSAALSVAERAKCYEAAGASMISVLCDASYFDGEYSHLSAARAATALPLLCKEFIIDEIQLDAARAFGADAVLLIVRCLSDTALYTLLRAAEERKLEALVEVHTDREAQLALECNATWIGVNARDLNTLEMDVPSALRILASLPGEICKTHLSGIGSAEDVEDLSRRHIDAALVGEVLMREDDPTQVLRGLVAAAH